MQKEKEYTVIIRSCSDRLLSEVLAELPQEEIPHMLFRHSENRSVPNDNTESSNHAEQ